MKKKGRGVSAGTILTLILTAAVVASFAFLFIRLGGDGAEAHLGAQKVFNLVSDTMQDKAQQPAPESTVRTVMVTLAPAPAATPVPGIATAAPAPPVDSSRRRAFTVTVGGLMAFESDVSDSAYSKTEKSFDYKQFFSLLRPKVDGDLTLAMLPQVINTADRKYGDALVPQAAVDGIRASGFEYVALNSSHILDQGAAGAEKTVQALKKASLSCLGVTAGGEQQHRVIQLNGVRIALLAYTESLTAKGKNARESQPNVLQLYSPQQAERDIAAVKSQGAEVVIVSIYWGKADTASATSAMKKTAYALAEAGADLVLGYRPTRILPMETISVPDDNGVQRQCLIVYSMGTLLCESREGYDISGMLLNLRITRENGRTYFEEIGYTPTYIWRQNVKGKMQYRVVCSADPPPQGMDAKQKGIMEKALNRVNKVLKDSPAELRKQ